MRLLALFLVGMAWPAVAAATARPASPFALAQVKSLAGTIAYRGASLRPGQGLVPGDRLDLAPGAWACLTLVDGTAVVVSSVSTEARAAQFLLQAHDEAGRRISLAVGEGLLAYAIPAGRANGSVISVTTPAAEIAVREGCGVVRSTRPGTRIGAGLGSIAVRPRAGGRAASLGAGLATTILNGRDPSSAVPFSWIRFIETDPLGVVGGLQCVESTRAAAAAREAPPVALPASVGVTGFLGATGSVLGGTFSRHPIVSWLLLVTLLGLLLQNSVAARLHVLLASALVLESWMGFSRLWWPAGELKFPVGALTVGWMLTIWWEKRFPSSPRARTCRVVAMAGFLLWVTGVSRESGPGVLDPRRGITGIMGLPRQLLETPPEDASWRTRLNPAAWVRQDPAPWVLALPCEFLAFFLPVLLGLSFGGNADGGPRRSVPEAGHSGQLAVVGFPKNRVRGGSWR